MYTITKISRPVQIIAKGLPMVQVLQLAHIQKDYSPDQLLF